MAGFTGVEEQVFFGDSNTENNTSESSTDSSETTFKDFYHDREALKTVQEAQRGEEFTEEELENTTAEEFREENDLDITDDIANDPNTDFDDVDAEDRKFGNTDEGAWDDAFGSWDETFARQFDNEEGGGFTDPDTYVSAGEDAADTVNDTTKGLESFLLGDIGGWIGENATLIKIVIALAALGIIGFIGRPYIQALT